MITEEALAKQILVDLRTIYPKHREYTKMPKRLRDFIERNVPEAEIVKIGRKTIIRLKEIKEN